MDDSVARFVTAQQLRKRPCLKLLALCAYCMLVPAGCYAPLHSPGIPARDLSNSYRWPSRTAGAPLNYSSLVALPSNTYLLGSGDLLEVTVPDLLAQGILQSFQARVQMTGEIFLPRLGGVVVGGLSISAAQQQVNSALAAQLLQNPGATVSLIEKGTVRVLVLGAVQRPGVHELPRYENDIAHALAAAEGLSDQAGDMIEVHRRCAACPPEAELRPMFPTAQSEAPQIRQLSFQPGNGVTPHVPHGPMSVPVYRAAYASGGRYSLLGGHSAKPRLRTASFGQATPLVTSDATTAGGSFQAGPITRISLRDNGMSFNPDEVVLNSGDVVVVPEGTDQVFYVVGPLSQQNRVRFSVGDKDREIGSGLLLPDDREVDVVTAVAMAGYLDPIESPTTVTVHRVAPDGTPLLVRVDLIAARSDPQETILIQPGDIVYLNPDAWWYSRRTMDRVIKRALGTAIGRWLTN